MKQHPGITVELEADTICEGQRISTFILEYPRFIHSELMTHRVFARNAASSRALPPDFLIDSAKSPNSVPWFPKEDRGMVVNDFLREGSPEQERAISAWKKAADAAIEYAQELRACGVHKSICNRLLEPFTPIRVIVTATEFANFWRLRRHPDAEPHFQDLANRMYEACLHSTPEESNFHMPYLTLEEKHEFLDQMRSLVDGESSDDCLRKYGERVAARSARVSWRRDRLTPDVEKDRRTAELLVTGSGFGHWSPWEHAAVSDEYGDFSGRSPFDGWAPLRVVLHGERENLRGHLSEYEEFLNTYGCPRLSLPE